MTIAAVKFDHPFKDNRTPLLLETNRPGFTVRMDDPKTDVDTGHDHNGAGDRMFMIGLDHKMAVNRHTRIGAQLGRTGTVIQSVRRSVRKGEK